MSSSSDVDDSDCPAVVYQPTRTDIDEMTSQHVSTKSGFYSGLAIALSVNIIIATSSLPKYTIAIAHITQCLLIPVMLWSYFVLLTFYLSQFRDSSQYYGNHLEMWKCVVLMIISSLCELIVINPSLRYQSILSITCLTLHILKLFPSDNANIAFSLLFWAMRVVTGHVFHNVQVGPYILYIATFIGLISGKHSSSQIFIEAASRFQQRRQCTKRKPRQLGNNASRRPRFNTMEPASIRFLDDVCSPFSLSSTPTGFAITVPDVKITRSLKMRLFNEGSQLKARRNSAVQAEGETALCGRARKLNRAGTIDVALHADPHVPEQPLHADPHVPEQHEQYKEDCTTEGDRGIDFRNYERTSDYETGPDTNSMSIQKRVLSPQTSERSNSGHTQDEYREYADLVLSNYPTPAVQSWHFDIFDFFNNRIAETPFIAIVYHIFYKVGMFEAFNIPVDKFLNFLRYVYDNYHDNPYHNVIHVADVLHTCFYLTVSQIKHCNQRRSVIADSDVELTQFKRDKNCIGACLLPIEVLATYLAAVVHDLDHPGRTNNFLIKKRDKLALLYNDRSVLENHHASEAWKALMNNPSFNFLCNLTSSEYARLRFLVVELILATDLIKHNKIIESFRSRTSKCNFSPKVDWNNGEERLLVCKMIIKIADVATPCKPLHLYLNWARRVQDEFYLQGDEERKNGDGIVSEFMDRLAPNEITLQRNFIDNVTMPVVDRFDEAGLFSTGLISNKCHLLEFLHYNQHFLARVGRQGNRALPRSIEGSMNEEMESRAVIVGGGKGLRPSAAFETDEQRSIPSSAECF